MLRFVTIVTLVAAACGGDKSSSSTADAPLGADAPTTTDATTCTAGAFLSCSGDDAIACNATGDGTVSTSCNGFGCDATAGRCNACTPSTVACQGDSLVTCGADGSVTGTPVSCALGCDGSGATPACNVLEPPNLAAATCDTDGTKDLAIATGTVAMDTGGACDAVVNQSGGPAICVMKYAHVGIASGATLRVTGTRALAIVATATLTVDGTIDASADAANGTIAAVAGPGAPLTAGDGAAPTGSGSTSMGGGGGGGAAKGAAGSSVTSGGGGAGGAITGAASLVPLVAGSSGGANGGAGGSVANGGLGGGGLELVSCGALTISATAVIDVERLGRRRRARLDEPARARRRCRWRQRRRGVDRGRIDHDCGLGRVERRRCRRRRPQGQRADDHRHGWQRGRRRRAGHRSGQRRRRSARVRLGRCGRCRERGAGDRRGAHRLDRRGRRRRRRDRPHPPRRAQRDHADDDGRDPQSGGDDGHRRRARAPSEAPRAFLVVASLATGCGIADFDVDQPVAEQMIEGSGIPAPLAALFPLPLQSRSGGPDQGARHRPRSTA